MLSGSLTFELSVFLSSKGILCFGVWGGEVQEINTVKVQRECVVIMVKAYASSALLALFV